MGLFHYSISRDGCKWGGGTVCLMPEKTGKSQAEPDGGRHPLHSLSSILSSGHNSTIKNCDNFTNQKSKYRTFMKNYTICP